MKIDGDEEAMNLLNNTKGSIENKIRAVYNLGYQRGYKVGKSDAIQILERSLMDMTAEPNSSGKPNNYEEPQTDCYVSDLCKHYGDKQICGRCRNRNLFCEAEPQPRCPKCGKRGYIRSLESMGVKLKVFDEYRWKCTNCNKYFKEEPKDEPQTDCPWK